METLNKLKKVAGNLELVGCENLISLGDLEIVDGNLDLCYCINLKDLGKLNKISSYLILWSSGITRKIIKEKYCNLYNKCNWDMEPDI